MITVIIDNTTTKTNNLVNNNNENLLTIEGNNDIKYIFKVITNFFKTSTDSDINIYYLTLIFNENDFKILTNENNNYSINYLVDQLKNCCYNKLNKYVDLIKVLPIYINFDSNNNFSLSLLPDNDGILIKGKITQKFLITVKNIIKNHYNNMEEIKQKINQLNLYNGL